MKILDVKELKISEIKVIKFARFMDHRGYFTETYRWIDFTKELYKTDIPSKFVQANETWSRAGTFRGLHFQWNPYMGKLVRCISGHLIDFALDIRLNSPTFGKILSYSLPSNETMAEAEWIYVPPGFAHGTLLIEDSIVEYLCTGGYNGECEAGISIFSDDIDWELCNWSNGIKVNAKYTTEKDRNAFTLKQWKENPNSKEFIYGEVAGI